MAPNFRNNPPRSPTTSTPGLQQLPGSAPPSSSIGGKTAPLPGQSAPPLCQHNHCAVSASATPSFKDRSECPEEGWPCRAGEKSLNRERHRKAGDEHRERDAPAPRAERAVAKSAKPQSAIVICTPSFNERSECPEEGWSAGPGRSHFTVSSANKPVACRAGEILCFDVKPFLMFSSKFIAICCGS